jgi:hypothetical protein
MKITQTYNDGSVSKLYEKGDKVIIKDNVCVGFHNRRVEKGTSATIIRCVIDYPEDFKGINIEPYWADIEGYGIEKIYPWEFE